MTLDCERWTLTHSSGWAGVLVGLVLGLGLVVVVGLVVAVGLGLVVVVGLGLVVVLGLGLGLAAMRAVSEAEAVVWDDGEAGDEPDDPAGDPDGEPDLDGDPEAEPDGEPDPDGDPDGDPEAEPDGEPDPEAEPDGEGDAGVRLGSLLGLVVAVEEPEPEGDGVVVGDFDGVGVGLGVGVGVGVGVGEDVVEAGRTWHFVSIFALVLALGLVEVPGLGEAAASLSGLACAVPASTPRVRTPPPTTLSAATRTCARRIRIALSPLLIRVAVCSSWVRRRLGDGWVPILISGVGPSYARPRPPDHVRAALAGWRPDHKM